MTDEDHQIYRRVGEKIRELRQRKKMSQVKLAEKLEVSRVSVVNIEAGRQHTPLHVLWRIAQLLDTEVGLLIPRRDEIHPELEPVKLDSETVAQIEVAANGDPETQRLLRTFISKVKSRTEPYGETG